MPATSTRKRTPALDTEPDFDLDAQIGFLLRKAYQKVSSHLVQKLRAYQITPIQFTVLARLLEHGEVSQNRLGRLAAMEPANIHGLVRRLTRRGLISSFKDPQDRRLLVLRLTPEGTALIETLLPLSEQVTDDLVGCLDAEEREQLFRLLERVIND